MLLIGIASIIKLRRFAKLEIFSEKAAEALWSFCRKSFPKNLIMSLR